MQVVLGKQNICKSEEIRSSDLVSQSAPKQKAFVLLCTHRCFSRDTPELHDQLWSVSCKSLLFQALQFNPVWQTDAEEAQYGTQNMRWASQKRKLLQQFPRALTLHTNSSILSMAWWACRRGDIPINPSSSWGGSSLCLLSSEHWGKKKTEKTLCRKMNRGRWCCFPHRAMIWALGK